MKKRNILGYETDTSHLNSILSEKNDERLAGKLRIRESFSVDLHQFPVVAGELCDGIYFSCSWTGTDQEKKNYHW